MPTTSPWAIPYPDGPTNLTSLQSHFANIANAINGALTTGLGGAPRLANSDAERLTIFPAAVQGNTVLRPDKGWTEQYFGLYNSSTNPAGATPAGWYPVAGNLPSGHMGKTNNTQSVAAADTRITMDAAQRLVGGMTFDNANDALVIPIAGRYKLHAHFYMTGGAGGVSVVGIFTKNNAIFPSPNAQFWKGGANDVTYDITVISDLVATDRMSIAATFPVNAFGTTGYNGCYLEVEYLGPTV